MKVKLKDTVKFDKVDEQIYFKHDKIYTVLSIEFDGNAYRIIDEEGYDPEEHIIPGYIYPKEMFDIVDPSNNPGYIDFEKVRYDPEIHGK